MSRHVAINPSAGARGPTTRRRLGLVRTPAGEFSNLRGSSQRTANLSPCPHVQTMCASIPFVRPSSSIVRTPVADILEIMVFLGKVREIGLCVVSFLAILALGLLTPVHAGCGDYVRMNERKALEARAIPPEPPSAKATPTPADQSLPCHGPSCSRRQAPPFVPLSTVIVPAPDSWADCRPLFLQLPPSSNPTQLLFVSRPLPLLMDAIYHPPR